MIIVLLIIIAIELGALIFLGFKRIPEEEQNRILRKVAPVKGDVVEWKEPEDDVSMVSKKLTEEITNQL